MYTMIIITPTEEGNNHMQEKNDITNNKAKNRGVKIRYVTEIIKENIAYCKEIIKYFHAEIRHLDGVKGNIEISDDGKEYVATANLQEAKPLKQLILIRIKRGKF